MRLKSYFAASVEAAMQQARQELGDEAMLLDSRSAGPQARHLGAYEVVFALPENAAPERSRPALADPGAKVGETQNSPKLAADLAALRRELDRVRDSVGRSSSLAAATASLLHDPELARLHSRLLAIDILPEIVQEIVVSCSGMPVRDPSGKIKPSLLRAAASEQLTRRLSIHAQLGAPSGRGPANPVVCMVGPPGAGKTSALVKLAIRHGLPSRKPMLFVSLDNLRVGGCDALCHFATLAGASFQLVDAPRLLPQIVEEQRGKHWIWIDTPGLGPRETDVIEELSEIIRNIPEIDTHLVLSATMKSSDLRVAAHRFGAFEPKKLLFAHLDETETQGGLLSALAVSGLPLSFLSNGQQIPEAIEPAETRQLLSLLLGDDVADERGFPQAERAVAGQ